MKFKKAFSVILAVAMVITLMPSMAFATSTNTVKAVPTVASDDGMPEISIDLEVKDASGWKDSTNDTTKQAIKLNFNNAEWDTVPKGKDSAGNDYNFITETVSGSSVLKIADDKKFTISGSDSDGSIKIDAEIISVSDNSIEFSFKPVRANKNAVFTLTFSKHTLKSGRENGPVEIAIDGLDSNVSSTTLTVATVGSSNTVATTNGDVKTYGRVSNQYVNTKIEIRETAVNSITENQRIKLTLPKGVKWGEKDGIKYVKEDGNLAQITNREPGNDGRSVYLTLDVDDDSTSRQVLTLEPIISIEKSASKGDITVEITSASNQAVPAPKNAISDASDLIIARYGDESVEVTTADEIPTIYAGFVKTNKDKPNWIQFTFKESVRKSLESGRFIDIELPEEVQVVKDGVQSITATLDKNAKLDDARTYDKSFATSVEYEDEDGDRSDFSLTVPEADDKIDGSTWKDDKGNTWSVFVPVTVEADFTGDITAHVSGAKAGIDEIDLVVAKAESPITVETAATEVKNGIQKQNLSDITITEKVVGYMDANTTLTVAIDNLGLNNSLVFDDADVEVTSGDLEIGKISIKEGVINIPIKEESTKASTLEITGISATLNRTLPEGKYDLKVGEAVDHSDGTNSTKSALIDNDSYNDNDFNVTPVTYEGFINIITPAPTDTVDTKIDAQFVIGQTSYTNNGQTVPMDAAAYIDANNRTMVPIRYIAEACGVPESDISWNQATQTATINGSNTVISIKMGSNVISTSSGNITMDTVAVNSNGRIYVPARYIANAFGADVTWDQATKTVTITK